MRRGRVCRSSTSGKAYSFRLGTPSAPAGADIDGGAFSLLMNLIRDAIEAMGEALEDVAGEEVLFQRGDGLSIRLCAVAGKSILTAEQSDGTIIQALSRDFTVTAEKLCSGAGRITPQKGDTVTRNPDGRFPGARQVHELMSPPYSPADAFGVRIRLHSVLISENA